MLKQIGEDDSAQLIPITDLKVRAGTLNVLMYNSKQVDFNVARAIAHVDYDIRYHHNDIAVVFLTRYAHKYEGLSTITLARLDFDLPDWFTVSGYGLRTSEGQADGHLRIVDLPILDQEECMKIVPYLSDTQFCVANTDYQQPKGDCYGDSGGPIVGYNWTALKWYLYGAVSAGAFWECGTPSYHTRISKHWDWIYSMVQAHLFDCGSGHPVNDPPFRYPNCRYPYTDPCYRHNTCELDASIFPDGSQ